MLIGPQRVQHRTDAVAMIKNVIVLLVWRDISCDGETHGFTGLHQERGSVSAGGFLQELMTRVWWLNKVTERCFSF